MSAGGDKEDGEGVNTGICGVFAVYLLQSSAVYT